MKEKKSLIFTLFLALVLISTNGISQENYFQGRTAASIRFNMGERFQLRINPELRFTTNSIEEYFIEPELVFKLSNNISFSSYYRLISNYREDKPMEYLHKFAFKSAFKYKIGRFTPKLSASYTNNSDDNLNDKLFRYKASLKYNIRKSKITPFIGAEMFHQYKQNEVYKMRYFTGLEYKLNKRSDLQLSYKLDYHMQKYENRHIISLGYKFTL